MVIIMKKRHLKKSSILIIVLVLYISIMLVFINKKNKNEIKKDNDIIMVSLIGKTKEEVEEYASINKLRLNIKYEYSDSSKGVSKQSIPEGNKIIYVNREKGAKENFVIIFFFFPFSKTISPFPQASPTGLPYKGIAQENLPMLLGQSISKLFYVKHNLILSFLKCLVNVLSLFKNSI